MDRNSHSFDDADVIFVSDMFSDEYGGGAELTTESFFKTSPYKTFKLKSSEVDESVLSRGVQKTWIFFNFRGMNHNLIPAMVQNLYYFVVEYDYKFCQYRSLDLHLREEGEECDCHNNQIGKVVSTFYAGSEHIFWMSYAQKSIFQERFPFLDDEAGSVLSSTFDVSVLEQIENLHKERLESGHNNKNVIVDGNSWIKGVKESSEMLESKNIDFDVIGGLSHSDLLRTLSSYKCLTFMPLGADTCPRLVIEAKLLGLELELNDNVQHAKESWFLGSREEIETYLLDGHNRFWDKIAAHLDRHITISGYTQAYNVLSSEYPWRESITSLLGFCDEVIVLDGGSNDGTYEELQGWASSEEKLVVKQLKRDWDDPRFALFNGQQKAAARTLCNSEWCWQVDIDEVVHETDYGKIRKLLKQMPKPINLVSLPVTEYWGGSEKVRVDINPWKWRLSRNDPHITHDVNAEHRAYDEEGNLFSRGSDGDDYVHTDSYVLIPDSNFYTPELHQVRLAALEGNNDALVAYEGYINKVVEQLPGVYHYSWFDLKRKVNSYKNFWSKHWASLYNRSIEDVPENNMFFDKKWSDVTDDEISDIAKRMKNEMGGWVFHNRIDFNKPTPWIKIEQGHPKIMSEWIKDHEGEEK